MFSEHTLPSNTKSVYRKLPHDIQTKILDYMEEDWSYVPENLKKFNYGSKSQQSLLGNMIRNGRLDESGMNIIKQLNEKNVNILRDFNLELLDKNILDKLDIDYVMEVGVYSELSSIIVELSKNEVVFNVFAKIVNNSKLDDSLFTFYTKTRCCLEYLFENRYSLEKIDINNDDFINYILFKRNIFRFNKYINEKYYVVDIPYE